MIGAQQALFHSSWPLVPTWRCLDSQAIPPTPGLARPPSMPYVTTSLQGKIDWDCGVANLLFSSRSWRLVICPAFLWSRARQTPSYRPTSAFSSGNNRGDDSSGKVSFHRKISPLRLQVLTPQGVIRLKSPGLPWSKATPTLPHWRALPLLSSWLTKCTNILARCRSILPWVFPFFAVICWQRLLNQRVPWPILLPQFAWIVVSLPKPKNSY